MGESHDLEQGGPLANELVDRLYKQLKSLAARVQWREANPALHPSSLVHEAYLKLMRSRSLSARPDSEVIGIFAHVMRQILVDAARRNRALRRGGGAVLPLVSDDASFAEPAARKRAVSPEEVLTIDAATTELRQANPRQATIIEYRFYLGMTVDETAMILGLSRTTVEREERIARKFLRERIQPTGK